MYFLLSFGRCRCCCCGYTKALVYSIYTQSSSFNLLLLLVFNVYHQHIEYSNNNTTNCNNNSCCTAVLIIQTRQISTTKVCMCISISVRCGDLFCSLTCRLRFCMYVCIACDARIVYVFACCTSQCRLNGRRLETLFICNVACIYIYI